MRATRVTNGWADGGRDPDEASADEVQPSLVAAVDAYLNRVVGAER